MVNCTLNYYSQNFKTGIKMKIAKFILIVFTSLALLSGCGGSGEQLTREDSSTDTDTVTADSTAPALMTISMSILDMQGNVQNQLIDGAPLNVNVRVIDANGSPVAGQLVSYTLSQSELATFSNDTASSLTNSDGIASIQISASTLSGSGSITASVSDGVEITDSVTTGFSTLGLPESIAQTLRLTITLFDQQGSVGTLLADGSPLNANVRVLDGAGNPVVGQIIDYSLSQTDLASFNNDTATGLTNSDGVANIQLTVGSLSGSGSVTASVAGSSVTVDSVTAGFSSLGSEQATAQNLSLDLALFDQLGASQNQLTNSSPLDVYARVLDATGLPVSGLLVTFSLSSSQLATFGNDTATALTNSDGIAIITMTVGEQSGSGTVTASVDNAEAASLGFSATETIDQTPQLSTLAVSIVDAQQIEQTLLTEGSALNINALVLDASGNPMPNMLVRYEINQAELAVFNNDTGTSLTNSDGIATIQISVGSLSGSGEVTISVEGINSIVKGFTSEGALQARPSSIELYANAVQLASSGGDTIELIAVMKNEQNILLPNIAVAFSVDEDGSLSNIDLQTGADGTARAFLTTQNNKQNRLLTVTASSADLTQQLQINVVGTEVNINGPSSVIINDSAPITIVMSDSDGAGIANQTINLSTSLGTLDDATPATGANGQVTVNFTAGQAGDAVITATALNATSSFQLTVQQDDFSFTDLPTENISTGENQTLRLRWFKNNAAFVNGEVTVTASRGEISLPAPLVGPPNNVVTTDADGIAEVIISSQYAGPASVSAVGSDGAGNEVTARAVVEFVATDVNSIFVDATPDIIGPEGQTTTITAVLRDSIGNLVKGKTVDFSLDIDSSGGSIAPNTAITDSNGIASTVYTSNAVSGDNGVTIAAQSDGIVGTTELTVGDRAFDISLGTGSIIEIPDNSTYMKEFSVFVTDASGRPVANAELSTTITPTDSPAYYKGGWAWNEDDAIYVSVVTFNCPNEDVNRDGILHIVEDINRNGELDIGEDTNSDGILDLGEDTNGDGFLTPGNVASISFKDNVSRTDEFGQATLQIRYPKQFGNWTTTMISVFGQSAGSESVQSQEFRLGVAAEDLTEQASPPPASPFGSAATCGPE